MKKLILASATFLFSLGLVACQQNSSSTEGASQVQSQQIVAKHSDVRLKFNQVTLASKEKEFKGGTNLATLKDLFGEPDSHEQTPAGDVTLDVYKWTFDAVEVSAQLYEDSAVVRTISNFYFIRDPQIDRKAFDALTTGMTYRQVVDQLGEPDVLSQAVSSDKEELQALWVSGLKTEDQSGQVQLLFENNQLKTKNQTGLK